MAQRENRRQFWAAIAAGLSSEDAAIGAGVSQPVGFRWFREAGGMPPKILAPSSKPPSERYLSFMEREEIALLRAQARRGPAGTVSDTDLLAAIRAVLDASPVHGEGHRKVWARLRHGGIRTSLRRVLRLMKANDLLAPSRVGTPRGPRNHDDTIIPDKLDSMWGTDLTTTITGEGQVAVFVAIDHYSAACIGIHASHRATHFEALEPIRQGVRRHFGAFGKNIAYGLAVRHDHGSQYMSDHFQRELTFLGIESSPAFVRAPECNGCAERFIRALKENLLWVRTYTVKDLRQALLEFRETYNTKWLIQRHGFRPSAALRQVQLPPAALAA